VAKVDVETYGLAVELDDPAPRNVLAAKFSVPFALATALVQGSSGVSSFTQDKVEDRKTLDLAARIGVTEDPSMSAQLPDMRPARVTLHMCDGTILRAETRTNRGDYADPYSSHEIRAKYQSLTRRRWTQSQANLTWGAIMDLNNASNLKTLFETLKAA
jgi:2-methylcitrate dehydratase PrpD